MVKKQQAIDDAQLAHRLQSAQQCLAAAEAAAETAKRQLHQSQLDSASQPRKLAEQHSAMLSEVKSSHEAQLKAQLRKLSEQHSAVLSQMNSSHEAQTKTAREHHEVRGEWQLMLCY